MQKLSLPAFPIQPCMYNIFIFKQSFINNKTHIDRILSKNIITEVKIKRQMNLLIRLGKRMVDMLLKIKIQTEALVLVVTRRN